MASGPFDVKHPLFRPLWVRVLVCGVLAAWTVFEVSNGAYVWAGVFAAAALYLGWQFFVAFKPEDYEKDTDA